MSKKLASSNPQGTNIWVLSLLLREGCYFPCSDLKCVSEFPRVYVSDVCPGVVGKNNLHTSNRVFYKQENTSLCSYLNRSLLWWYKFGA